MTHTFIKHQLLKTLLAATILFAVSSTGCSRKNPVSEISAAKSNISVVEPEASSEVLYWAAWRGPEGNGNAPDQELPTTWNESDNITWRADVPGRGHSSPIVVGDSVFLATAVAAEQKQQVLAFDRTTGESRWTTDVHSGGFPSDRAVHQKATNANGTLACDGVRLYTAFLNSDAITASAIDLDGEIVWQQEIGKFVSKFGYAPSPVIYKSLVIFAADNSGGGYIAAIDSATGEIAWRISRSDASSYSSPAIHSVGGRDQLLISGGDAVASFDPATGEELWKTPCISDATCGTIIASTDKIFASGGYPDKETVCLDANGEKVWSNKTKIYEPSLSLDQDRVIAVSDDGIAYCWDVNTGDTVWRERLGGKFSASPMICNGNVYVPNLQGETVVFRNDEDSFQQVAKNKLGDDAYASPAVADGQIFMRIGVGSGGQRQEQLVCIGAPAPAE